MWVPTTADRESRDGGGSAALSQAGAKLGTMGTWATGELLGFDLETTGVDRFEDVPVSYSLVSVVDGVVVRSWSGLVDPGRPVPAESTVVHGISTEEARAEGMPLAMAVSMLADAVVAAGRRGVPLVGMRLDYDLTMIETQAVRLCGRGIVERGWCGPVLDAAVLDRHLDPDREGRRTLGDLCAHYGIDIARPHDATADAIASVEVVFALSARHAGAGGTRPAWAARGAGWRGTGHGRAGYDARRRARGQAPIDPRDYPVARGARGPVVSCLTARAGGSRESGSG